MMLSNPQTDRLTDRQVGVNLSRHLEHRVHILKQSYQGSHENLLPVSFVWTAAQTHNTTILPTILSSWVKHIYVTRRFAADLKRKILVWWWNFSNLKNYRQSRLFLCVICKIFLPDGRKQKERNDHEGSETLRRPDSQQHKNRETDTKPSQPGKKNTALRSFQPQNNKPACRLKTLLLINVQRRQRQSNRNTVSKDSQ